MPKGVYLRTSEHTLSLKEANNPGWFKSGHSVSRIHRKKLAKIMKLQNPTFKPEIRMKISDVLTGRRLSEERKRKVTKENCHFWRGGISFEPYSLNWTESLRESVRRRDRYHCQLCEKDQFEELKRAGQKLSIHHIDYNKKNCDPNNLITLCHKCHRKTYLKRSFWSNLFKDFFQFKCQLKIQI